jgi:hypothetical protein
MIGKLTRFALGLEQLSLLFKEDFTGCELSAIVVVDGIATLTNAKACTLTNGEKPNLCQ